MLMPREIEIKAKVANLAIIERKLKEMGATRVSIEEQKDVFFDIGRPQSVLRLRCANGEKWTLTYKGVRRPGLAKNREEIETRIQDGLRMTQIFSSIGLRKLLTLAKHRIIYRFHWIEISLDHVAGLGRFVELEAKHRVSISQLLKLLEEIGIDRKMVVPESYIELKLSQLKSVRRG